MAAADVYVKYLNGVPYYTDNPRIQGFKKVRTYSGRFRRVRRNLGSPALIRRYTPTIHSVARTHGLDPALVFAVIKAESDFDPYAISSRGAMGLMQLRPETAYRMGVGDILDPKENIEGGARYLKFLLGMFGGDLQALSGAGPLGPDPAFPNPSPRPRSHAAWMRRQDPRVAPSGRRSGRSRTGSRSGGSRSFPS
jgi:soluble lytic murein transglycosylase-like protein